MERSPFRRKLLKIVFWGIILYTALTSSIVLAIQFHIIPVPKQPEISAAPQEKQTSSEAIKERAFVERFVREYLFWTQGLEESRADRLKPFWKPQMDLQGGIDFTKTEWNSYVRHADVWEIKERPDQSGIKDITVFAETALTHVKKPNEQKRGEKYLVVSIQQSGDSYVVVDIPHFIAPPVAVYKDVAKKTAKNKGEQVSSEVHNQVEQFMKSFWKVYTTGEPQEIAYYKHDHQPQSGLTGILRLVETKNLTVTQVEKNVIAECDVVLEDLDTGVIVNYHYTFTLAEQGDRWYVVNMKQGVE
ncbi:conjugal transfer protein [Hazenella coriacea]|uniref:Conjugative transposon protein TcpC n=1 Tax=Hazenella coriacea TaxID=1179467 RepID=A0A4R3LA22_9BACL|nr:conjugal transfer protein [Hazenella coriacea]TCS96961.1 conjugative transposon protein TcpC [Hazenella coriacea]